jgi:N-acetylglutamate synthase-like GNAT family acetyltransferase/mannose-6-phosphate isomerase-like protein (cupin superfamily)
LLNAENLPTEDLNDESVSLIVAQRGREVQGAIGLQVCGDLGLLRSLVVAPEHRGHGVARALYERLLAAAHRRSMRALYLLTTTAAGYFRKLGFATVERSDVPSSVRETRQFRSLCPASSVVFHRDLRAAAIYFPKDALSLRAVDDGSKFVAVSLQSSALSYFEVAPHGRFERHTHDGEQITMVLEGELFFELDDRVVCAAAGEVVAVPTGVPHSVWAGAQLARAVDAWSFPRRDLESGSP